MQKKYKVRIREVLEKEIEVICSNENEAVEIVEQEYRDGVHVLDSFDLAQEQSSIHAVINESSVLDVFNDEFNLELLTYEDLLYLLNNELNDFYSITKDAMIAFLQLDLKYKRFINNYFSIKSTTSSYWYIRFKQPLNDEELNILFNLLEVNSESDLLSKIYTEVKELCEHTGTDPVNTLKTFIKDIKKSEDVESNTVSNLLDKSFAVIGFDAPFELVFDF